MADTITPNQPIGAVAGAPNTPPPTIPAPAAAPAPAPASVATTSPTAKAVGDISASPVAASVAHHSLIGKAFRSLMGSEVNYEVDPKTGKLVQTQSERQPGQIWRSMIAGVMLGGAVASEKKARNFGQGAAIGGAAVGQDLERKDLMKREQAQNQFRDQLAAQKEQREQKSAASEEDLRVAQIAMHNAQTLHENQLTQQESFKFHAEVAAHGKSQLQPYLNSGMLMTFRDIPESQMNDILKNNPKAATLLWEPTDTVVKIGADGKPTYETTYSAVDPKGKVKVTDANIASWKKAGLDQIYGENFFDVLKKDKELDAGQYMALTQREQELHNREYERKKQSVDIEKEQSEIEKNRATISHLRMEMKHMTKEEQKDKLYNDALDEFDETVKKGGSFADLSPKSQMILSEHVNKAVTNLDTAIRDAVNSGNMDEAKRLMPERDDLAATQANILRRNKTAPAAPAGQAGGVPPLNDFGRNYIKSSFQDTEGKDLNLNKDVVGAHIWADDRVPPDQKLAITKATGAIVPWSAVVEFSEKAGIKPEVGAAQLKAAGISVKEPETESVSDLSQED